MKKKHDRQTGAGFSLLEVMLAAGLLAGSVLTIGALSGRSLSAVRLDRETEKAWLLADAQLKLIDAIGIVAFMEAGVTSGTFEQAPEYSWRAAVTEVGTIESLYALRMEVWWASGGVGAVRRIACETRFCDPVTESETTTTTGQGQPAGQGQQGPR